jgi:beta-phosphoglucomutase
LIEAVIFDLDGVIVDTAHYHFLAWSRLARELGFQLTEADNEKLKGVSRVRSLEIILEMAKENKDDKEKRRLAEKKNGWFLEYLSNMKPEEIFPGVVSLIKELRERGLKVALASSSKNANTVVNLLGIRQLFDTIVDGTMVTHSKPDPEIFLLTAELLDVAPSACLVFEDAAAGITSALSAGMACVGVGAIDQLGEANLVIARTGDFTPSTLDKLTETF